MMKKRVMCLALAVMSTSVMTACNKKKENAVVSDLPKGEVSYPIAAEDELVYWSALPASISTQVTNLGETPFAKHLEEATGIKIKYEHPAQGQDAQTLDLLVASGELPDMVQAAWYLRGPEQAIENHVICELGSYMKDYAPNLMKYLNENPDIDKMIKTDTGNYYGFPTISNDDKLLSTEGFMLRSDWLKELGLEIPETIEEWDVVLEAFKKKCEIPFGMNNFGQFAGGFDTCCDFYVEDGKVRCGYIDPQFKDFLAKMNEWYEKGYIDKNYAIADSKVLNSNMLNGISGIAYGPGGGKMGTMLTQMQGKEFDLAAVPFPTAVKGTPAKFGRKEMKYRLSAVAISSTCKNPALATRFLDYGYSEEGHMFYNFGTEGESYNMVDGYPTYDKSITDTSDGRSMAEKLALVCRSSAGGGAFVQDVRYIEQYYAHPQQQDAIVQWSKNEFDKRYIPQVTMTMDELNEYTPIISEIDTYVSEAMNDFIIGAQPIENFDKYVETVKSMGIDRAIELQQAAYDRFLKR